MKDPNYFKEELSSRTNDLTDEEKEKINSSLNANIDKEELKKSTQLIADGQIRVVKVNLDEFLKDSIYYRTLDHSVDILEYTADKMFVRVAGKIALGTFVVDQYYVNQKPLKDVENVEMSPDLITDIKWS